MRVRSFFLAMFVLFIGISISSFAAGYSEISEPLLGIEFTSDSVKITVSQCGGTQKDSFRFDVQKDGNEQFITVFRTKIDDCKMMPQREVFEFSLAEVGIDARKPVLVTNSLFGDEIFADMSQHELEHKGIENTGEGKTDAAETFRSRVKAVFDKIGRKSDR